MAKIIGKIKAVLGIDKSNFDKGLGEAQKKTSSFKSSILKLGGAFAAAFSIKKIIDFGSEVIALAGKAEGVKAAFNALNQPALLNDLRKATQGTVDDLKLMQSSVKAQNFKIPLDQLASYFEFATKRAAQTGESVDYLVQSIIDGVGRKSSLVLDNLGISATELQKEIKKTGDFGAAAGAIMTRELSKMGDVTLTGAQKAAQLKSTWENIKTEIGGKIIPIVSKIIEFLNNSLPKAFQSFGKLKTVIINVINWFIDLYNESIIFRGGIEMIKLAFKQMGAAAKLIFSQIKASFQALGKLISFTFNPKNWGKGFRQGIKDVLKDGFASTKENVKTFGKTTAENFKKAYENTLKRDKIKLLGDDPEKKGKEDGAKYSKGFQSTSNAIKKPDDPNAGLQIGGIKSDNSGLNDFAKQIADEELAYLDNAVEQSKNKFIELAEVIETDLGVRLKNVFTDTNFLADSMVNSVDSLSAAFQDMFEGSAKGFKTMAIEAIKNISRIILAQKAQALAGMAGAEARKGLLGLATMTIGFAAIQGIFASKIPKLAGGGVVPSGYPNDSYPAMLTSGEVITPPGKLPNNSGGMGEEIITRISGKHIDIVLKRWSKDKTRIS